jgi:hypothetical protein
VLYAVQQPTTAAAWQTKPSWYAVSKLDETISPDLERFLANRMKADTIEVNAGHLSLVSVALISGSDTSYRKILASKRGHQLLGLGRARHRCTVPLVQNRPNVGQSNCPVQTLAIDCPLLPSFLAFAPRMRGTRGGRIQHVD